MTREQAFAMSFHMGGVITPSLRKVRRSVKFSNEVCWLAGDALYALAHPQGESDSEAVPLA